MNKTILLIFLSLLPSCGRAVPHVDNELASYNDKIVKQIFSKCAYWETFWPYLRSVKMAEKTDPDFKDRSVGICRKKSYSWEIKILRDYWNKSSENRKYELIAHELFHCVLREKHHDTYKHFMAPNIQNIDIKTLEKQIDELLDKRCYSRV